MDEVCRPGICDTCGLSTAAKARQRRLLRGRSLNDQKLFGLLVDRHQNALLTYARALTSDQWVAEEAAQETFVRAWKYLDSFRGDGCFEGWLLRICRNCVVDLAAKNRPTVSVEVALADGGGISSGTALVTLPDRRPEVFLLMDELPVPQREALALCGLLGYSYEAAATVLDVPIGTIRSRVARARERLANALQTSESQASESQASEALGGSYG